MKGSIRLKLSISIIGLITFFVVFSWFLSSKFIENYYIYQAKKSLLIHAKQVGKNYSGDLYESYQILEELQKTRGIHIFILNEDLFIKYESLPGINFRPEIYAHISANPYSAHSKFKKLILENLKSIQEKGYLLSQGQNRQIGTKMLDVIYKFKNNDYIILSKPMISLKESAIIAIRFSIFSGLITLILGIILALIFSKRFTKPIMELNNIAKSMKKLDFSQRYFIKSNDEIGELGESINSLSDQLNVSITEIKEANEKLKAEIEYERKLERMRKEFISSVSHELRTPVSLILGYTEGLKYNVTEETEDREFYCDVIIDESNKMTKLIEDLLDLSKLEYGNNKLEIKKINLSVLLEKIVSKYSKVFSDKDINLDINIVEKLYAFADEHRIEQVITNFFNNSINHINEDKNLKISLYEEEDGIKLSVYNSGKPIPEDLLERIWESFYKIDKARTRDYGGTGLGLSIVRAILNLHNSEYGARNIDEGVEFWFKLSKN